MPPVRDAREPLLVLDGVETFYGSIQALRGVSFKVPEGSIVTLLGANGAGKSTTLKCISGLVSASKGTVSFRGERIDGLACETIARRGISHVPEGRELFPELSVLENLRMGFWSQRKQPGKSFSQQTDHVMDLLPRLRERADQAAGTMSGGEQQMLVFARALMSSPRLILVDELSLGLAPLIVAQLFEVLKEINTEGTAFLLVEQFVHLALKHTSRAYVLSKGSVAMAGTSAELLADTNLVATYLGSTAAAALPT